MNSVFMWFFWLLNLVLLGLDTVFILKGVSVDSANVWNWGWTIASLQLVYIILSFKTIGPTEIGAILFFGRPVRNVKSGLVFVPWIICSLRKETGLTIQLQIPAEPEKVIRSKEAEGKEGMFLPIRATTGSWESALNNPAFAGDPALCKDDPLSQQMTLEPTAQFRFRIVDMVKFIRTIGTVKEAEKQLRDTAEGVIQVEFAKRTPALIVAHRTEINKSIRSEIGILVKDDPSTLSHDEGWGIVVERAQLLEVDLTHKVNTALSQVAEAKILAKKTVMDAVAAKMAKTEEGLGQKAFETSKGEGVASAKKNLLLAIAAGQAKVAETAKTDEGRLALTLQTASDMAKGSQYSIVGTDGMMGTIAGAMETLKRLQGVGDKKADDKAEKGA